MKLAKKMERWLIRPPPGESSYAAETVVIVSPQPNEQDEQRWVIEALSGGHDARSRREFQQIPRI
jgi:hypothetical protein